MSKDFTEAIDKLTGTLDKMKEEYKKGLKTLKKIHDQEIKILKKEKKDNVSSIASQRKVPNDLVKLLKLKKKDKYTKTDIIHKLYEYIDDKHLKDSENKKIIHPDNALIKALCIKKNELLTYDNFITFVDRGYGDSEADADDNSSDSGDGSSDTDEE